MSAGTNAAPLLVPSADVTAKNLRAQLHSRSASVNYDSDGRLQRRAVSILDRLAPSGRNVVDSDAPKFTRLVDDTPSLMVRLRALIKRLRAKRAERKKVVGTVNKPLRAVARACDVLDYLPVTPLALFFASVFATVVLNVLRPTLLHRRFPAITPLLDVFVMLTALLCIMWRRSAPLHALSRGEHPYRHPVDSCLEPYGEYIAQRAADVKAGEAELKENHAQLDALRRELAKDANADDPSAVLKPNKRAAAMIKAGALGAGYDAEKAAEAERMRKEESLRRSHQHWRERSGSATLDDALEELQSHAAKGYRKHTKELKMRAAPRPANQQLAALRRAANTAAAVSSLASSAVVGARGSSVESPRREQSGSSGDGGTNGVGTIGVGVSEGGSRGGLTPNGGSRGGMTPTGGSRGGLTPTGGSRGGATPNETSFSFSRAATGHDGVESRRFSEASERSIQTAASAPAPVVHMNSKKPKLRLFRRKRDQSTSGGAGQHFEDVPVDAPGAPPDDGSAASRTHRRLPSFPRMSARRRRSRADTPVRANTMDAVEVGSSSRSGLPPLPSQR